ncbi:MAG: hypothetical protein QRY74_00765 [Chlamydia sp.]
MDFTREPIIETVITARDGHRIVIRSSKNSGQEEFFVDALEVVSFHNTCFYRCLERPKAFIVPASDYEVLEIRESRISLKTPSFEGIVKVGPSVQRIESPHSSPKNSSIVKNNEKESADSRRESNHSSRDQQLEKRDSQKSASTEFDSKREFQALNVGEKRVQVSPTLPSAPMSEIPGEVLLETSGETLDSSRSQGAAALDRRKDKKRNIKRRRGSLRSEFSSDRDEAGSDDIAHHGEDNVSSHENMGSDEVRPLYEKAQKVDRTKNQIDDKGNLAPIPSLLPPPTTLIRDELARMRNNELYKGAFYAKEEGRNEVHQETSSGNSSIVAEPKSAVKVESTVNEAPVEEKNFLVSSSLRFEDDEDNVQSNAYTARPSIRKKREIAPAAQVEGQQEGASSSDQTSP